MSVGEVLAAKPLAEGLKHRFPGHAIFVSTTTETGRRLARERLQSVDGIFYFPLDWVVPVRRALRSIHPALVIVMETEIWPNFLREARRRNVPVIFANARISERSFARFKRWEFPDRRIFQADAAGRANCSSRRRRRMPRACAKWARPRIASK